MIILELLFQMVSLSESGARSESNDTSTVQDAPENKSLPNYT